MPISIRIPTPLRKLTQEKDTVHASATTVQGVINDLNRQYPGLQDRLCDEKGDLRKFVNIYLNDEEIGRAHV